jgi:hypothetical protein
MTRCKIFMSRKESAHGRLSARAAVLSAATCAAMLLTLTCAARAVEGGADAVDEVRQQLVVRLRSFVPGAVGQLTVEPSAGGGHARLRIARLPAAASVSPQARAFVVWATGGRVVRLGELRRASDGSASFEFARPAGFDTYSLVVTAEASATADRPEGAFIFSTRAGEISALYPPKPEPRTTAMATREAVRARTVTGQSSSRSNATSAPMTSAPASPRETTHARMISSPSSSPSSSRVAATSAPVATPVRAAGFYESVNAAVEDPSAARTLTLAGVDGARRATGFARVATREGVAYVRVRFRRMPSPTRLGARKYVMWAQAPDADDALFLRALPRRGLNRRATYARRPNFNSNDFNLLVTAERRSPAARPRGRHVLKTVNR